MLDEKVVFCLKISQQQWIEKLSGGSAWFGLIDNYIKQAEETGNNEQGDRYEGVFARCKRTSNLVEQYMLKFGDDLEIIDDGEFCFLRRKSSRYKCAFCMYGIKNTDLSIIGDVEEIDGVYKGKFHYDIDTKMYEGFLQDGSEKNQVSGYYCSAGHINEAIEKALESYGYKWKRNMVVYDIDLEQEFLIEPLPDYPELWHKRKDLSYQHETRFLLYDVYSQNKGVCIEFEPISDHSGNVAIGELYFEGSAIFERI